MSRNLPRRPAPDRTPIAMDTQGRPVYCLPDGSLAYVYDDTPVPRERQLTLRGLQSSITFGGNVSNSNPYATSFDALRDEVERQQQRDAARVTTTVPPRRPPAPPPSLRPVVPGALPSEWIFPDPSRNPSALEDMVNEIQRELESAEARPPDTRLQLEESLLNGQQAQALSAASSAFTLALLDLLAIKDVLSGKPGVQQLKLFLSGRTRTNKNELLFNLTQLDDETRALLEKIYTKAKVDIYKHGQAIKEQIDSLLHGILGEVTEEELIEPTRRIKRGKTNQENTPKPVAGDS